MKAWVRREQDLRLDRHVALMVAAASAFATLR
jgi:hypothetical protein